MVTKNFDFNKRRELLFGLKAELDSLEQNIDNTRAGFAKTVKRIIELSKQLRFYQAYESVEQSDKNNEVWNSD